MPKTKTINIKITLEQWAALRRLQEKGEIRTLQEAGELAIKEFLERRNS